MKRLISLLLALALACPTGLGIGISGKVLSDGRGLAGVWVSDGYNWAQSSSDGSYSLESEGQTGYVFIVIPSGYFPCKAAPFPAFWKTISKKQKICDFELRKVDNEKFRMILTADWHMAKRLNDVNLLAGSYWKEMTEVDSQSEVPVYELALGDLSWNSFWERTGFTIASWKEMSSRSTHPIFTVIGNHDYDMTATGKDADTVGSELYRETLGPLWYSFNLGKVHFVVINDIFKHNDGKKEAEEFVSPEQIEWLREDLSHISKDTPVVLASHAPYEKLAMSKGKWFTRTVTANAQDVLSLLKGFEHVEIVAGHRHVNNYVDHKAEGFDYAAESEVFAERSIPALSGTMWVTHRNCGADITTDGIPQAYEYIDADGKDLDIRLKCIGSEQQMRLYDMNAVADYWNDDPDVATLVRTDAKYGFDSLFRPCERNAVYVNVFAGDPHQRNIKVEIFENGVSLPVRTVYSRDPLHVLVYEVVENMERGKINPPYATPACTHMFKAVCSSPDSPVTVRLTDSRGRVTEEVFQRPLDL